MKKSFSFKKYVEQLDYVRLANGIYWTASVFFFTAIYIIFFTDSILPEYKQVREENGKNVIEFTDVTRKLVITEFKIDEFTKPWYNGIRYGILLLSAFSAGLFIKLWSYFYKNFSKRDFAMFWFSLAMLSWCVAAIFRLLEANKGWMTFLSQVNNLFFLTSLPFFKHGYSDRLLPWLNRLGIREENYFRKTWLFFLLISPTYLWIFNDQKTWWGYIGPTLNLIISCLTGFMLLVVLWTSFEQRRFNAIKWLSLVPILCLWTGEFFFFIMPFLPNDGTSWGVFKYDYEKAHYIAAFYLTLWKVTLMFLVAGLAMSWLYEQIDTQRREMTHLVKNSLHQFLLDLRHAETINSTRTDNKAMISRVENLRDFVDEVYLVMVSKCFWRKFASKKGVW